MNLLRLIACVLALLPAAAPARAMQLLDRAPKVTRIADGSVVAFALRFDRPVDHAASRLVLKAGLSTRAFRPRLNAQPNTLFASLGRLAPGAYELQWSARSPDGGMLAGGFTFSVLSSGEIR